MSDDTIETDVFTLLDVPARLAVKYEVMGCAVVVRAWGEVDMSNADLLDEQLRDATAMAVPPAPVVLDLAGVSFLPSTGLKLLSSHHDRCAEHGSPLRVVAAHRRVLRPIQITGLDQKLALARSVDQALDA
jgi:anti-sigma B factor antagonist